MPVYEIVSIVVTIIGLIALIVYGLFYNSPKDNWIAVILIILTISMIGISVGDEIN